MSYEIINADLRIAAVETNGLTEEQAHSLLEIAGAASLDTLAVFYDTDEDYIVINKDSESFGFMQEASKRLIGIEEEYQLSIKQGADGAELEAVRELLAVIKRSMDCKAERTRAEETFEMLSNMPYKALNENVVSTHLYRLIAKDGEKNTLHAHSHFYNLGYMHSVRNERARRNK